jgi:NMD protein affecting ribosome stability and mRNA decay
VSKHCGRPRTIRRVICFFTGHTDIEDDKRTCACNGCRRCGAKLTTCVWHIMEPKRSNPQTLEPKEVTGILEAFAIKVHEAAPGEDETPAFDEATKAIEAYAAQQNTALLREALQHKQGLWTDTASDGNQHRIWAIPASILEAKLESLEQQK